MMEYIIIITLFFCVVIAIVAPFNWVIMGILLGIAVLVCLWAIRRLVIKFTRPLQNHDDKDKSNKNNESCQKRFGHIRRIIKRLATKCK